MRDLVISRASRAILSIRPKHTEKFKLATPNLIGRSATFCALLDNVGMVAPVDSAVLLQGETGTGKEVVARAIHEAGPRARNRFVALNCSAIPGTLLESELFGHEKGAFTGAAAQTLGRFQFADHGTLFLDEIGDMPLELQPKLLRVLQEKQFERLGGSNTLNVDVRVIAATNQDLGRLVRERKFRADLYYRLNVFPINLPPLRDRMVDVPLLARHFVQKFARQQGKVIESIPNDVMEALQQHDWPGNIRELQNVIERGVIFTAGGQSLSRRTTETLTIARNSNPSPHSRSSSDAPDIRTLADAERAHITATLRETNWVISGPNGAAAQLGLPRTTLTSRMQRLGISRETGPARLPNHFRENSEAAVAVAG
jgi:formate hydrogenlyase transcriptional activator